MIMIKHNTTDRRCYHLFVPTTRLYMAITVQWLCLTACITSLWYTSLVYGQESNAISQSNSIPVLDGASACLSTYAKFSANHTVCVKPNRKCKITQRGVTKQEQKLILDWHNYYRNLIASGNETSLGFPSAANMLKLEWDSELAFVAQKHADQCEFKHDCYECRRTERYDVVGQNLYIYQTSRPSMESQWQFVIKEWYDEIKIAPPVVATSFDLFDLNIGHFTQMAWAPTSRIGCGYVTYDVTGLNEGEDAVFKTAQLYTCNYAPGGNFLGEKMYKNGTAASQCPKRWTRSKRFQSLCEYAVKLNKNKNTKKVNKKISKSKKVTNTAKWSNRITSDTSTTSTLSKFPNSILSLGTFELRPYGNINYYTTRKSDNIPKVQLTNKPPISAAAAAANTRTTVKPVSSTAITVSSSISPSITTNVIPSTTTTSRTTPWWSKWASTFQWELPNSSSSSSSSTRSSIPTSRRPTRASSNNAADTAVRRQSATSIAGGGGGTTTTTTRSPPWKTWSPFGTTRSTTAGNFNSFTTAAESSRQSTPYRFMLFEMSQNGTTTHKIRQAI